MNTTISGGELLMEDSGFQVHATESATVVFLTEGVALNATTLKLADSAATAIATGALTSSPLTKVDANASILWATGGVALRGTTVALKRSRLACTSSAVTAVVRFDDNATLTACALQLVDMTATATGGKAALGLSWYCGATNCKKRAVT